MNLHESLQHTNCTSLRITLDSENSSSYIFNMLYPELFSCLLLRLQSRLLLNVTGTSCPSRPTGISCWVSTCSSCCLRTECLSFTPSWKDWALKTCRPMSTSNIQFHWSRCGTLVFLRLLAYSTVCFSYLCVSLFQYLMEGSYNKVFLAKGNIPAESYTFFIDILLDTIR